MARDNELGCLVTVRGLLLNETRGEIAFDNTGGVVCKIMESAFPNPSENSFPDFLFPNGALEHFQIGSSPEFPRGGSKYKCEESKARKTAADCIAQSERAFLSSPPSPWTYEVEAIKDVYEDFSYRDFMVSLKKHFASHVESLRKCGRSFGTVVFLMEQQTARMGVWENGSFERFYLLSKDREALDFLSKYSSDVRYVVYLVGDTVEIIDIAKTPELIQTAEFGCDIRGGRTVQIHLGLHITI